MKKFLAIGSFLMGAMLIFSGCKKVDPLPFYDKGTPVALAASATTISPTRADSSKKILAFSWTDPKYSTAASTYKFVVEIDSAGKNFSSPARREVIGKQSDSITGRELNAILLNKGYAIGATVGLDVRVISSYGNNNEQYNSNTVKVVVTPYADPSVFSSSATTVTGALNTASQTALTFSWTPSFVGYSGIVTYTLQYDSIGKNFASPHEMAVGASLLNRIMTQGEINTTALDEGVAGGSTGKIEYRIKATTAQGASAFSNAVAVTVNTYVPIIRLYMPGGYQAATGNGSDWDPPTAPEFIRDLRPEAMNKLYYMYIFLPANAEFKITDGRSWTTNYGGTGGTLSLNGSNLKVTAAGVYRVSVDLANMKYDIRDGRMGFVGDAVGAGWTPSNVFPNYAMGFAGTNLFVGVTNFSVNGWKMMDYNDWNNGDITANNVRTYGSNGPSGSVLVTNGPNMPNPTAAGRYRVIWDGRDVNNVKYEMSLATEMRVVGDGINQAGVGDWDPASSPQMTYNGNGVWTITLTLKANKDIKFLAGNAWGAFDYEDAGAGTGAGVRKIKWEGGDNFKTPSTAGTYTITLNENTQTMSIN